MKGNSQSGVLDSVSGWLIALSVVVTLGISLGVLGYKSRDRIRVDASSQPTAQSQGHPIQPAQTEYGYQAQSTPPPPPRQIIQPKRNANRSQPTSRAVPRPVAQGARPASKPTPSPEEVRLLRLRENEFQVPVGKRVNVAKFGGPAVTFFIRAHDIDSITMEAPRWGEFPKKVGFEGDNFTRIGAWGGRTVFLVNSPRAGPGRLIFTMD